MRGTGYSWISLTLDLHWCGVDAMTSIGLTRDDNRLSQLRINTMDRRSSEPHPTDAIKMSASEESSKNVQ